MGLDELQPGNTLRAKATAIGAFKKFLKVEQVTEEYIRKCIECDETGKSFVTVMDKFGMYLAFSHDLAMLQKQNVSVDAGGVLFLRLIRMKTSEEQGLSLFPDADFQTCPLVATALALIVQAAPARDLVGNLSVPTTQLPTTPTADAPLVELLNAPANKTTLATPSTKATATSPTIYAHVNRILERVAPAGEIAKALSSHSFRRGGAQHANGCEDLTERWIFDRGSWNMSTTNKGFNYIFNTSKEDHKVAKVLAGYKPKETVALQDPSSFDSQTLARIEAVQQILFASRYNLATSRLNIDRQVIQVLTAAVLRHFPHLKALNTSSPAVSRIEKAVISSGSTMADLMAWASHLARPVDTCEITGASTSPRTSPRTNPSNDQKIINHQAAVIKHLIDHSKRQDQRMNELERKLNSDPISTTKRYKSGEAQVEKVSTPVKKQRRSGVTHLHATWFTWYAQEPRWQNGVPKRQRSTAKLLVGFMKLFLPDGFVLDIASPSYLDDVLELGMRAEKEVLAFVSQHQVSSRGSSAVLKHLQAFHATGKLNSHIARYQRLLRASAIQDPAPEYTQDFIELAH
ncbi:hypothetical protein PHMEG_0008172 [Phytophthora megakarya]|uniref:Uncharacterized protein n=1 Tax=Phytophthora megakarya TaxID=4795 RepID=A0A225WJF7_9STRA|nr:hypothetical protein PHMEG_0008172 [Phytophthora megakarya]